MLIKRDYLIWLSLKYRMPFLSVTIYQLKYSNCLLRPDNTDPNEFTKGRFRKICSCQVRLFYNENGRMLNLRQVDGWKNSTLQVWPRSLWPLTSSSDIDLNLSWPLYLTFDVDLGDLYLWHPFSDLHLGDLWTWYLTMSWPWWCWPLTPCSDSRLKNYF